MQSLLPILILTNKILIILKIFAIELGYNYLCKQNSYNMEMGVITDVDFLPSLYQRDTNKDLYQLVYGILIYHNYDKIYEVIAHLSKEQKSDVLRKAKIKQWRTELQRIIQKLKSFGNNKNGIQFQVFVYPYHYSGNIGFTINLFDFAITVLDEMTLRKIEDVKLIKPDHFHFPIRTMKEQFEMIGSQNRELYELCIKDEMVRRGLLPQSEKSERYDLNIYSEWLIRRKHDPESSEYTIEEIQSIVEDIKNSNKTNEITHTLDIINSGDNLSQIDFFGVFFYALRDYVKDRKVIQRIAWYAMSHCYTKKQIKDETVRKYYDAYNNVQYKKKSAMQIKVDTFKYVEDELRRLKLAIPEEVKNEIYPPKKDFI